MSNEKFGFRFWLGWILKFAGSFFAAALFWTFLLQALFGVFAAKELVLTWAVAVFGSWYLLIIPFMRKKERIWKRLNADQEKAVEAWLRGMSAFVGILILSLVFWSWKYRGEIFSLTHSLSLRERGGVRRGAFFHPGWMKSVLTTWLVLILPLLVWMYRKADVIFKNAAARQSRTGPRFKTLFLAREQRLLPDFVVQKVQTFPEFMERGHVVTLCLKDGRKIPHVFILQQKEILGIYDRDQMDFQASEVADAAPLDEKEGIAYDESKWLRLDVRG